MSTELQSTLIKKAIDSFDMIINEINLQFEKYKTIGQHSPQYIQEVLSIATDYRNDVSMFYNYCNKILTDDDSPLVHQSISAIGERLNLLDKIISKYSMCDKINEMPQSQIYS